MKQRISVVIGCRHPLVGLVTEGLALRGDRIVLVGVDDTRLLKIAGKFPNQIETLSLSMHGATRLAHLREAWEDTPIHSYFDLSPMCTVNEPLAVQALNSMEFLSTFKLGLRAGGAKGSLVFRDTANGGADASPLDALMGRVLPQVAPAALKALRLRGYDSTAQHRLWADRILETAMADAASGKADYGWNPNAA